MSLGFGGGEEAREEGETLTVQYLSLLRHSLLQFHSLDSTFFIRFAFISLLALLVVPASFERLSPNGTCYFVTSTSSFSPLSPTFTLPSRSFVAFPDVPPTL